MLSSITSSQNILHPNSPDESLPQSPHVVMTTHHVVEYALIKFKNSDEETSKHDEYST